MASRDLRERDERQPQSWGSRAASSRALSFTCRQTVARCPLSRHMLVGMRPCMHNRIASGPGQRRTAAGDAPTGAPRGERGSVPGSRIWAQGVSSSYEVPNSSLIRSIMSICRQAGRGTGNMGGGGVGGVGGASYPGSKSNQRLLAERVKAAEQGCTHTWCASYQVRKRGSGLCGNNMHFINMFFFVKTLSFLSQKINN